MSIRRFVIVTGVAGAGKSQALKSFEDLGFYCLDNLPPALLPQLMELAANAGHDRIAIAPNVHTSGAFGNVIENLALFDDATDGTHPEILFLDASDETLVRRFSETRRRHPLGASRLTDAIVAERSALASLRDRADRVWDTSSMTSAQLKERIGQTFAGSPLERRFNITLIAFGYKYGLPLDADIVLDVRFLPNPYYVEGLRELTGAAPAVAAFLDKLPETAVFLSHAKSMLGFLIPHFISEGKPQLTIAVGCTGGRHRSVFLARKLRAILAADSGLDVTIVDRDVDR